METSYDLLKHEAELRAYHISSPLAYLVCIRFNECDFSGYVVIDFIVKKSSDKLWVDFAGDFIRVIRLNNNSLRINRQGNHVFLGDLKAGNYKLQIEFASSYSSNGTGLHKFVDPSDSSTYIYSYMCPYYTNKVFPCFDQPDLKGTFNIVIEAHENFVALSNESVYSQEKLEENYLRHTFNTTPPLSTYILAFICGNFVGAEEIYFRNSLSPYIPRKEIKEWLQEGLQQYHEIFGIEMPFSKCSQVFCPEFNMGAMENAGCVTINDSHVWKEKPLKSEYNWLQNTVLHELCHMWFGNYVTLKWWDDLWLNESFATYFSYYITSKKLNPDVWLGFLFNKMKAYNFDSLQSTHPVHVHVTDTQEAISNLDNITYWKGASLLKNLAFIIGEEKFSEGLKNYFAKFAWANVCFQDFVDSMQNSELNQWITEWVDTKGLNNLELKFEHNEFGVLQSATFVQSIVSGEILRNHSILVEGFDECGSVFKSKLVIPAQSSFEFPQVASLPRFSGIIVNSEDHGYVQVSLDENSVEFFFQHQHIHSLSALNRGIVWQSLWNRVESLKTSGAEFLTIVAQLLEYENEEEIIDLISSYSLTVLDYCPSALVPHYSHLLFESIFNTLKISPENKCLQRKIFLIAQTAEDIYQAYEYSLNLHRSEKWRAIMLYSTILSIQEIDEILKKELLHDCNDSAILLTYYCKAAAYDNKEETWNMIVNKKQGPSMVQIKYAMMSFWQTKNKESLRPYYQKYFEYLPLIIQNYDREYAENFMTCMFPKDDDSDKLIESLRALVFPQLWVKRIIEDTIQALLKVKVHASNFLRA